MMATEPQAAWGLPVKRDRVPPELKVQTRWVVWAGAVIQGDKFDKIPKQAADPSRGASVTTPAHWSTFDMAMDTFDGHGLLSGIGFVLTDIKGMYAIDLDHCVDLDGGIAPWAMEIVHAVPSYWELSPSGKGLRCFALGQLPGRSFTNNTEGVEMYGGDSPRYVTVTGQAIQGHITAVDPTPIYDLYCTAAARGDAGDDPAPERILGQDLNRLWDKADKLLNPALYAWLRHGDTGQYHSRSEATFAVMIALYSAGFTDSEVYSLGAESPYVCEMALDHRKQNIDKALAFIWGECRKARARSGGAQATDFDVLSGPVPAAPGTPADAMAQPENAPQSFPWSDWAGVPVPPREWLVDEWIPARQVTLLMGPGGVGKSLLTQQLAASVALGADWMGLPTRHGRALSVYCEDEPAELQRRATDIADHYAADLTEMAEARIWPRIGMDNLLMVFNNQDAGTKTQFYLALERELEIAKPDLLILDTLADLFGGNENIRPQARQFINMLAGLALKYDCAIVLCGHPSKSGQSSGDGTSGSTGWDATVRSRLYLSRAETPNYRVLSRKKSNYAAIGAEHDVSMLWHDGVLKHQGLNSATDKLFASETEEAEMIFMECLAGAEVANVSVSTAKQGRYAPRVFAKQLVESDSVPDMTRMQTRLEGAMERLLRDGRIRELEHRPGHAKKLLICPEKDENGE